MNGYVIALSIGHIYSNTDIDVVVLNIDGINTNAGINIDTNMDNYNTNVDINIINLNTDIIIDPNNDNISANFGINFIDPKYGPYRH